MTRAFPARFEGGMCPADCGQRIHEGDPVRFDADDRLVHDQCTAKPDPLELKPTDVVCGVCWLITPCRCDE